MLSSFTVWTKNSWEHLWKNWGNFKLICLPKHSTSIEIVNWNLFKVKSKTIKLLTLQTLGKFWKELSCKWVCKLPQYIKNNSSFSRTSFSAFTQNLFVNKFNIFTMSPNIKPTINTKRETLLEMSGKCLFLNTRLFVIQRY